MSAHLFSEFVCPMPLVLLLGEVSAACVSCFVCFFFALHPSGGQWWCWWLGHKLMSALKSLELHTITLPHSSSFWYNLSCPLIMCENTASLFSVERPPQEALFVVRYTKLSTAHDFKNRREGSFSTSAQSTAGQRGDGAEELMWRQALLPLCLTVAHHLLPIYLRVSDDKLAPLLVMGYCKMESRLDLSLSSRWKYNFKWSVCVDEDARRVAVAK